MFFMQRFKNIDAGRFSVKMKLFYIGKQKKEVKGLLL